MTDYTHCPNTWREELVAVWQMVSAWHQRMCWQKCNVVSCSSLLLSSFTHPTDFIKFLRFYHLMQIAVIVLFWSTSNESSFSQCSLQCTYVDMTICTPTAEPLCLCEENGSQLRGRVGIAVNEVDQTDNELQGQTNRDMEVGRWILMISLGGGENWGGQ